MVTMVIRMTGKGVMSIYGGDDDNGDDNDDIVSDNDDDEADGG